MKYKCEYLWRLGYSEKDINSYISSWNNGIIEFLEDYSDEVFENMYYLSTDFNLDFLDRLPIFYPETFVMNPTTFKTRFELLKSEFPCDYIDIIEKQF